MTLAAIDWVLAQQQRALSIPIRGVHTARQLIGNLGPGDVELERADLQRLEEALPGAAWLPGEFGGVSLACPDTVAEVANHHLKTGPLV